MNNFKVIIRLSSILILMASLGLIVGLFLSPQAILQNFAVDRFLSTIKIKSNSSSQNLNKLSYDSNLELQILENIRKGTSFEKFCIIQGQCNFSFSFSSDIPRSIQNRIRHLIRKNYPEDQDKEKESQSLLLKFEIFTSKKNPYLQTSKNIFTDVKLTLIEDLFLQHQNNESLVFQIDYFRHGNKIQETAFKITPSEVDFGQKKTR